MIVIQCDLPHYNYIALHRVTYIMDQNLILILASRRECDDSISDT